MKFIFAGTTEFGIPALEALMRQHELLFVITQPDKPAGRNKQLAPPPIKLWAQSQNIRILQPQKISEIEHEITAAGADLMLVAAYGQIIPANILKIPKHGAVNIHGSILPGYRGASPIQTAILNGDKSTGISLIVMDEKMDHGPVLATKNTEIDSQDTFKDLYAKLAQLSAGLCLEILPKFAEGLIHPKAQDESQATYTKLLNKNDGKIDWTKPARTTYNQIRALNPEPGTWTTLDGKIVKILSAQILPEIKVELPGKIYKTSHGVAVKAQDQSLLLKLVQPEGKKPMDAKDFANGIKELNRKYFL